MNEIEKATITGLYEGMSLVLDAIAVGDDVEDIRTKALMTIALVKAVYPEVARVDLGDD